MEKCKKNNKAKQEHIQILIKWGNKHTTNNLKQTQNRQTDGETYIITKIQNNKHVNLNEPNIYIYIYIYIYI